MNMTHRTSASDKVEDERCFCHSLERQVQQSSFHCLFGIEFAFSKLNRHDRAHGAMDADCCSVHSSFGGCMVPGFFALGRCAKIGCGLRPNSSQSQARGRGGDGSGTVHPHVAGRFARSVLAGRLRSQNSDACGAIHQNARPFDRQGSAAGQGRRRAVGQGDQKGQHSRDHAAWIWNFCRHDQQPGRRGKRRGQRRFRSPTLPMARRGYQPQECPAGSAGRGGQPLKGQARRAHPDDGLVLDPLRRADYSWPRSEQPGP